MRFIVGQVDIETPATRLVDAFASAHGFTRAWDYIIGVNSYRRSFGDTRAQIDICAKGFRYTIIYADYVELDATVATSAGFITFTEFSTVPITTAILFALVAQHTDGSLERQIEKLKRVTFGDCYNSALAVSPTPGRPASGEKLLRRAIALACNTDLAMPDEFQTLLEANPTTSIWVASQSQTPVTVTEVCADDYFLMERAACGCPTDVPRVSAKAQTWRALAKAAQIIVDTMDSDFPSCAPVFIKLDGNRAIVGWDTYG